MFLTLSKASGREPPGPSRGQVVRKAVPRFSGWPCVSRSVSSNAHSTQAMLSPRSGDRPGKVTSHNSQTSEILLRF